MGCLINNEEQKKQKEQKKLGFPYPLRGKKKKSSSNLIGEIPINSLPGNDFESMLKSAPEELKASIGKERLSKEGDSSTYYDLRDRFFLAKSLPAKDKIKGEGSIFAFLFCDYDFVFLKCRDYVEAEKEANMIAKRRGNKLQRVYKQTSKTWKRVKTIA